MSNNAAILFITDNDRILLVRDRKDRKWMIPGGKLNRGERSRAAAFREFQEETTFRIDERSINSEIREDIIHRNGSKTAIFIIKSSQRFGQFIPTNETDMIHYIKIDDFINLVQAGIPHPPVTELKSYVAASSQRLIAIGAIGITRPIVQRLYLTYGDNHPMQPWGGFHITICGSNFTQPIDRARLTRFYTSGNRWTFSSTTMYEIKNWNGVWTIVFNSQTINSLSRELKTLGFTNIKGPLSGRPWHVSLYGLTEAQAHQKAQEFIVNTATRPNWFLTICEDNGNGTYRWRPL
jgi:8-oxo-dGTP pyrophosphatase MutT (NUDIX family)